MIFNLRGPSGSGKSTVVWQLLERCGPAKPITSQRLNPGKVVGYELPNGPFIAGRYKDGSGGIDITFGGLGRMDRCEQLVLLLAKRGHVLFEGVMISSMYKRWAEMARAHPFVWLFLDTPLELCIERTQIRREGRSKPLNTDNIVDKYNRNQRYLQRAQAEGFGVYVVRHDHALEDTLAVLEGSA